MDVRLVSNGEVEDRGVNELQKLLEGEDGFVWVDIPAGDEEAVHVLSEVFRFHPMAVKDAVERNRLPKMHAYHDHVCMDPSIQPCTQTLPYARPGRCFSGSKPGGCGRSHRRSFPTRSSRS
jgi:hypothetical protein